MERNDSCTNVEKGELEMSTTTLLQNPKIVSREEWLAARRQLLTEESGWGYDAVVCADSVGNDQGDSAEPAQHDSIHRPVKLAGLAEGPAVRQFLHQRGADFSIFLCRNRLHSFSNFQMGAAV